MASIDFNAEAIEPTTDFTPLPVGEYSAIIAASEMKATKSGTGQYLQLTYDIIEGQYKGRKIFENLNLVNPNSTAQEIAQRALSAICRAVNVMHPKESEELHDKPLIIKVGIRPASGDYEASNVVKGYKTYTATASSAGNTTARPWE